MLNQAEALTRLRNGGWKMYKADSPPFGVHLYMQCLADARVVDIKRKSAFAILRRKDISISNGHEIVLK